MEYSLETIFGVITWVLSGVFLGEKVWKLVKGKLASYHEEKNFKEEHDKMIHAHEKSIKELKESDTAVCQTLNKMQASIDALAKNWRETNTTIQRDIITRLYYRHRDSEEWTEAESKVFFEAVRKYEELGNPNGEVHAVILPAMAKLRIVEDFYHEQAQ